MVIWLYGFVKLVIMFKAIKSHHITIKHMVKFPLDPIKFPINFHIKSWLKS
jgi:hypothetical protein